MDGIDVEPSCMYHFFALSPFPPFSHKKTYLYSCFKYIFLSTLFQLFIFGIVIFPQLTSCHQYIPFLIQFLSPHLLSPLLPLLLCSSSTIFLHLPPAPSPTQHLTSPSSFFVFLSPLSPLYFKCRVWLVYIVNGMAQPMCRAHIKSMKRNCTKFINNMAILAFYKSLKNNPFCWHWAFPITIFFIFCSTREKWMNKKGM